MAHEAQVLSLPELIEHVVHHSGLLEHYQNDREGADRLENLQELVNAAAAFVAEANFEGLPAGRIPDDALAAASLGADASEALAAMSPLAAFLTHASLERSEEHTSELQSLMRISYAVFCLKKKKKNIIHKKSLLQ